MSQSFEKRRVLRAFLAFWFRSVPLCRSTNGVLTLPPSALPGYNAQQQPVFRVSRNMVPVAPEGFLTLFAAGFLLVGKRPLLVELQLPGQRGGGGEFVVQLPGMAAGEAGVAHHGVLVDLHQPADAPYPAPFARMPHHRDCLCQGQAAMFKHGALPLRKALHAGQATKAADLVLVAAPPMPSQVAFPSDSGIWT